MDFSDRPQLTQNLVYVVLETAESRLQELSRFIAAAALLAVRVQAADPAHDAARRTGADAGSVEPGQQRIELLVLKVATAVALHFQLDLFVDEREQDRVVSIEDRHERAHCPRIFGLEGQRRRVKGEESADEDLESRHESRR